MSINPEAVGGPPEDADEYLKKANPEDPRSDEKAPAHEPAGPQNPDEPRQPTTPPE